MYRGTSKLMGYLVFKCKHCHGVMAKSSDLIGRLISCAECRGKNFVAKPKMLLQCPHCSENFHMSDEVIGNAFGCLACGNEIFIQGEETDAFEREVGDECASEDTPSSKRPEVSKIVLKCQECGKQQSVAEQYEGKLVRCSSCKKPIIVTDPPYELHCNICGTRIRFSSQFAGEFINCPDCKNSISIPQDIEAEVPDIIASCPKCGDNDVPFVCPNCEKKSGGMSFCEDGSVECICGFEADRISCPECDAIIVKNWFRWSDDSKNKAHETIHQQSKGASRTSQVSRMAGRQSSVSKSSRVPLMVTIACVCIASIVAGMFGYKEHKQQAKPVRTATTARSAIPVSASPNISNTSSTAPVPARASGTTPVPARGSGTTGSQAPTTTPASSKTTPSAYRAPATINGSISIVFRGYELPMKQVPVYLIEVTPAFGNSYNHLAAAALPHIRAQQRASANSREWIRATESLIEVEKERVVLFRNHTLRTLYSDNNGMFAFHDLKGGQYLVFVEGTVENRMLIWSELVDLKAGDRLTIRFNDSNAGATERVYAFAQARTQQQEVSSSPTRQYTGDELARMGVAASDRGDNAKAVEYYMAGAKLGHALSIYNLGASYIDGLGVPKNIHRGLELYKIAAEKGLPVAQTKLGLAYYRGYGVRRDWSRAAEYFSAAARQGDKAAAQALDELLMEDARERGVRKNPPDRDAAEYFLTRVADVIVQNMINSRRLVSAQRVGFTMQYVQGRADVSANATVHYDFQFYTQGGLLRRNRGYLFFYHDPRRRDWFNSDTNIDGLPRY